MELALAVARVRHLRHGRAWSEAKLFRLAYAYEQAANARRPPPGLPAL
jgi:hypothetical protein